MQPCRFEARVASRFTCSRRNSTARQDATIRRLTEQPGWTTATPLISTAKKRQDQPLTLEKQRTWAALSCNWRPVCSNDPARARRARRVLLLACGPAVTPRRQVSLGRHDFPITCGEGHRLTAGAGSPPCLTVAFPPLHQGLLATVTTTHKMDATAVTEKVD